MTTPFNLASEQINELLEPLAEDFDVGELTVLGLGRELIAFRFNNASFLVLFSSPFYEAGEDEELLAGLVDTVEANEQPAENSRIVKFCRADATTEFFNPSAYRLPGTNINDFIDFLTTIMVIHASAVAVEQYFYWASTRVLDRLYTMVFQRLGRLPELQPFPFRLIDKDLGAFCGYERI